MNFWAVAGLVLLALVLAGVAFIVIQFKTFERGVHHDHTFLVNKVVVKVKIHFAVERNGQPPLPPMILRWFKTYGFAMLGHIFIWYTVTDAPRVLVCHELIHRIFQHIIGGPKYVIVAAFERLTQKVHDRRGMEEMAIRGAPILAATGSAEIQVNGHLAVVEAPFVMAYKA